MAPVSHKAEVMRLTASQLVVQVRSMHSRSSSPYAPKSLRQAFLVPFRRSPEASNDAHDGKDPKGELPSHVRQALAVAACLAWMAVSSGLILVNKYIMSTDRFHYPMALSGLGMAFSSVASWLVCRVRLLQPSVLHPQASLPSLLRLFESAGIVQLLMSLRCRRAWFEVHQKAASCRCSDG